MIRRLLRSNAFVRSAKRLIRKNPHLATDLKSSLEFLSDDAFHPLLKTHKLKGEFENSLACSAGYDLRIVFQFVKHKGQDAILLECVGTHDEVY